MWSGVRPVRPAVECGPVYIIARRAVEGGPVIERNKTPDHEGANGLFLGFASSVIAIFEAILEPNDEHVAEHGLMSS